MSETDSELAQALARGEQDAMRRLWDRYHRLAHTVALRLVKDADKAEDVVQDAFWNIWRSAASIDTRRPTLRPWLCTVVHNRAVDSLRCRSGRQQREEREIPIETAASGRESDLWAGLLARLRRQAIADGLATLNPKQRQALELAYFDGLTQREVADMVGVPLGTVKSRIHCGLVGLRQHFKEIDEFEEVPCHARKHHPSVSTY